MLHLLEALVVGGTLDFKAVLSLRLGWLEWASQDADLGIFGNLRHLWVRELFVDHDALNEARIFECATGLGHNLDQVKVYVAALEVGNVENSAHSEVCIVLLALADDFGAKGCPGACS